jgi:hypothetical protein
MVRIINELSRYNILISFKFLMRELNKHLAMVREPFFQRLPLCLTVFYLRNTFTAGVLIGNV